MRSRVTASPITFLVSLFLAALIVLFVSDSSVHAINASIYISSSVNSVNINENVVVSVRANTGGANIDSVNLTLHYDSTKLQYLSVVAGGPITSSANYSNGGGIISGGAYTTTPTSGDILVLTVTFTAKVGSGSSTLSFSQAQSDGYPTEIDSGGISLGATTTGATISFTTPVATVPPVPSGTTKPSSTKQPSVTIPSTTIAPTTPTPTPTPTALPAASAVPKPVISTLKINCYDKNKQPLRNQEVTLHSDPQVVWTDSSGLATFKNVTYGNHTISHTEGKAIFSQTIVVASADAQTVVFNYARPTIPWLWICIVVIILMLVGCGLLVLRLKHTTLKQFLNRREQTSINSINTTVSAFGSAAARPVEQVGLDAHTQYLPLKQSEPPSLSTPKHNTASSLLPPISEDDDGNHENK